jgi:hypothetical protein
MIRKKHLLSLFTCLSLLGISTAQANCRSDYISCSNSCILPGIAGALTSKNTNTLQSCTNICDQQRSSCEVQEERLKQIEAANTARQKQQAAQQLATQTAERDTQARMAFVAQQQKLSAARQRYKSDMVFETSQILAGAADQVTPVTTITKLKIGDALIGDLYFYIDEPSNTAIALNLTNRQQRQINVPYPAKVSAIKNNDQAYAVIESQPPNKRELAFQLFNDKGDAVTGLIQTDLVAYFGQEPTQGTRSFMYTVHNNTLYVYTWLHAILSSGSSYKRDTQPLEMRAYNIQTGTLTTSLSIPSSQTLSLALINQQPVLFAAKPEQDQLVAFDAQTGAERYRQPLGIGNFGSKDHAWLTLDTESGLGMTHYRSDDQKTNRSSWFDLVTGNPSCRFNTLSTYHPVLQKFAAGNQIYNRQCQKETEFPVASGASLYPVEKGWASYAISSTGSAAMTLLDAQGNVRIAEPFSSYAKTNQGTLLLFTNKQPLRTVSTTGVVSTINWTPADYPQLHGNYVTASAFGQGYAVNITRFDENTAGADFQKQIVKDEFESTAQYRQRIAKLSLPFSRPVQLGSYDADLQRLQVTIDNHQTAFVIPAEQARSLRNAASVTFNGTIKVLEPEFVEITNPSLSGDGLTVKIATTTTAAATVKNTGKNK